MTSPLEEIQALKDFYDSILPLEIEFEEARLTKRDDPERWKAAVEAYEPQRTYWRQIGEFLRAASLLEDTDNNVTISPAPISAEAAQPSATTEV